MRRLLVLIVLLGCSLAAGAAERVLNFSSVVQIGADGALTVRERIVVHAEGREIKRGRGAVRCVTERPGVDGPQLRAIR